MTAKTPFILIAALIIAVFSTSVSAQTGSHIKNGRNQPGKTLWLNEPNAIRNVRTLLERGENVRALEAAEAMIVKLEMALSQEDPLVNYFAYNALCVAYNVNTRYAEAIEACDAAIKLIPTRWQAFNNRGTVHLVSGNADQAIADYSRALELQPDDGSGAETVRHNLALAKAEN